MKIKIILASLLVSIVLFTSCKDGANPAAKINKENLDNAKSRDIEIKKGTASVSFETREFNFGTVNEGEVVATTFKLTNSGKTDLVITNAQATCGCTIPVWPKQAIKPGESDVIEVKFDTSGKPNRQTKSITLTTNTESGREILTIKGSVIPKSKI